jgi:hypothetical protein
VSIINNTKIASAALANRLRPVLPFIISDTQKGFMKDRFMGENTCLLYDVIGILKIYQNCIHRKETEKQMDQYLSKRTYKNQQCIHQREHTPFI